MSISQLTPQWLALPTLAPLPNVIQVEIVQHDEIPWAAITSALVAVLAATIAWRNLAAAHSKLQVDGIINLTRDSGTREFQDAVKTILTFSYASATDYFQRTSTLLEKERATLADQLLLVSQFFDKIGYFVRKKHLDEVLIRATYGVYSIEVWEHTKASFNSSQITDEDMFPNNFRWLAEPYVSMMGEAS